MTFTCALLPRLQTYNKGGVGRIVIVVLIGVTCFLAPLVTGVQHIVRRPLPHI
jgi:hypothetical protein